MELKKLSDGMGLQRKRERESTEGPSEYSDCCSKAPSS